MEEGNTDPVFIEIAGVNFSIRCRNAEMPGGFDPAYAAFRRPVRDPSCLNIDVDLEFGEIPSAEGTRKLFDTEQSWSISSDGSDYFLSLSPPALDGPVWMARFDPAFRKVTVYCRQMPEDTIKGPGARNPFSYPLDQILLMHILAARGGAIFHAAGVAIGSKGFIFAGRSGAGKSTLMRQLTCRSALLLSDDRVVVRAEGGGFEVFGTPWPGEAGIAASTSAPLDGVFFIAHGSVNEIREIDQKEAMERLLPLASVPWYDPERMTDVLMFCEAALSRVPAYVLSFRPDRDIAGFLEDFAAGKGVVVGNAD